MRRAVATVGGDGDDLQSCRVTHQVLGNRGLSFGSTHYFILGQVGWALVDPMVAPLACLVPTLTGVGEFAGVNEDTHREPEERRTQREPLERLCSKQQSCF
jgi:hypothetical protein